MTTVKSDLLSLATRFAQLPETQRKLFLKKLDSAGIDFRLLPIPPRAERASHVLASFAQTRLWLHSRIIDEPSAYHITERLELSGKLDAHALRLSFDALIARHEALRTTFIETAEGVQQVVHMPLRCPWHHTDLSHLPAAVRITRAQQIAYADEAQAFDLAQGPLMRVHLIQLDAASHWLAITLHHIVADGWSIDVLLEELSSFYRAYTLHETVSLTPLPIQYADYALWQRRWLDAGECERQLVFWRTQLDASRDVLILPGAAPRPAQRSVLGARHMFQIEAGLGQRLRDLAYAHRATPFAVLLASLSAMLARASGESQIQIGVPVANRERAEAAGLIGFFVNTLTLSVNTSLTQSFSSLVDATQRNLMAAQTHQDVPFEQVVEALGVTRSASHHPLFQVMAAYGARRHLPSLAEVVANILPSGTPFAKFDLTLNCEENADGSLDAAFTYALDLFDADAVQRLAERFLTLLTNATHAPNTALGDLLWLPQAELHQLNNWNQFSLVPEEAFKAVHEHIAYYARACPEARGVVDLQRAFSRGEVEVRATYLAQRLIAAGITAEMRIGVALSRSVDLMVSLIAVLKSGAAFVPLDPAHPRERLAQIVEDAHIHHVISEMQSQSTLPSSDKLRIWLVDDADIDAVIDSQIAEIPLPAVVPSQAAYVIYTSGSTGKPKGVVVDHGCFSHHCAAIAKRYGAGEKDVFLLFQSVNFDGAHEGWFAQYMSGAAVAVTADTLWPPAQTCKMMVREGVTMTYVPPGCATQLAEWALVHGAPPTLRSLTVGGEATSREAFALMRRAFPKVRIVNGYGPTETVITPMLWMFYPEDDHATLANSAYLPIGTLVGARTAYVLDSRLNILPVGVIGELYLGGEGIGVARGYLDRPALTAERFVPDPFGVGGARLYRTGDLVKRRSDGIFDFIGRVDHQIKLRGLRIELGEIEAQLAAHNDVREAVAIVYGKGAQAALVAYVELNAEARARPFKADSTELDAHLRLTLPDYMVPAHIVVLDTLPRNTNSKVDRAALPEPQRRERGYESPHAGFETIIAQIWVEVLGAERIGRDHHFFELGGHSLAAVRVASRVAEKLGREIPVRALFEAPLLSQYTKRVLAAPEVENNFHAKLQRQPGAPCVPNANGQLPLSAAQLGLWYLWRSQPENAAYNIPLALRLRGTLNIDALLQAFTLAAQRHPALRTRLLEKSGSLPLQYVAPEWQAALPIIDLSEAPNTVTKLVRVAALTDEDALTPFDLARDNLWRLRLLRVAQDDHILSLVVHHIISDGDSIALWLNDVRTAYVATASDKAWSAPMPLSAFPLLPVVAPHAHLAFWRAALENLSVVALPPPAGGRSVEPRWQASRIPFELNPGLVQQARDMVQETHATLPMLLHAVLNVALYRATGATDQPIGVLASIRDLTSDAAQRALGLFINAVVVRTRLSALDTPATLLAAVRDAALAAYAHADTPFADIVAELRIPRAAIGNPLFQIMFNYMRRSHHSNDNDEWAGLKVSDFNDVRHRVVFELELDVVEHADGRISAAFSYASELVDAEFVEALTLDYLKILRQFVDLPHVLLGPVAASKWTVPMTTGAPPATASYPQLPTHLQAQALDLTQALAKIWSILFGSTLSHQDNFFDVGATSVDIVRFVDTARAAGYSMTIAEVFGTPYLAGLGERLAMCSVKPEELRDAN